MMLTDFLKDHTFTHTLPQQSKQNHRCEVRVETPNPDRSLRLNFSEFEGQKEVLSASLEVPSDAQNDTRAQCQTDENHAPVMGPISELEIQGSNGQATLHLTPDAVGAPYIHAEINGQNFWCSAQE